MADMKRYPDKYSLTRPESLFLAKKRWDENVYCGMRMENRAVTFPQTRTILDGVNVPGVRLDDITAILNMRDAWRELLGDIDAPLDLACLCRLNGYIARNEALAWGVLRTGRVGISGTDYLPPVPVYDAAEKELAELLGADVSDTERALNLFAWGARGQLFWDGNKRTSLTAANKLLVQTGRGMLTITDAHMERFNETLLGYYNTGEKRELIDFLYQNCIVGMAVKV